MDVYMPKRENSILPVMIDKLLSDQHSYAPYETTIRSTILANIASAKKRARQAEKHRLKNTGFRSMFRTYLKRIVTAIEAGDKEAATSAYKTALPLIDQMANKGLIHKNKAARHKSRLNTQILAM